MQEETIPFDQFLLKWRFTDPKYNLLPEEVLARLTPLSGPASRILFERTSQAVHNHTINSATYPHIESYHAATGVEATRAWLDRQLCASEPEFVGISWNSEVGMRSTLQDFCYYWDDFCYAGSDDVIVLPKSEEWVLYYFHEEKFYLGRRAL